MHAGVGRGLVPHTGDGGGWSIIIPDRFSEQRWYRDVGTGAKVVQPALCPALPFAIPNAEVILSEVFQLSSRFDEFLFTNLNLNTSLAWKLFILPKKNHPSSSNFCCSPFPPFHFKIVQLVSPP
jgi:hypothetical protein